MTRNVAEGRLLFAYFAEGRLAMIKGRWIGLVAVARIAITIIVYTGRVSPDTPAAAGNTLPRVLADRHMPGFTKIVQ
jgi:hypothetical protein